MKSLAPARELPPSPFTAAEGCTAAMVAKDAMFLSLLLCFFVAKLSEWIVVICIVGESSSLI